MVIDNRNFVHCGIILIQVYSQIKDDLNKNISRPVKKYKALSQACDWSSKVVWPELVDPSQFWPKKQQQCGLAKANEKMSTGKMRPSVYKLF